MQSTLKQVHELKTAHASVSYSSDERHTLIPGIINYELLSEPNVNVRSTVLYKVRVLRGTGPLWQLLYRLLTGMCQSSH